MRQVKEEGSNLAYVFHSPASTLDLSGFTWVPLFVRDQKLRAEMVQLEREVLEIQSSLIDKAELKTQFLGQLQGIRNQLIECTADSLKKMQDRKSHVLLADMGAQMLIRCHLLSLTDADIDSVFAKLPQGVMQVKINKKVTKLEKRISEIQQEIDRDLSPKSRWYFDPAGERESYPRGDRWSEVVNEWKQVASRYTEPVNHEGERLKTEAERTAWKLLGFDNLQKVTPLREPLG